MSHLIGQESSTAFRTQTGSGIHALPGSPGRVSSVRTECVCADVGVWCMLHVTEGCLCGVCCVVGVVWEWVTCLLVQWLGAGAGRACGTRGGCVCKSVFSGLVPLLAASHFPPAEPLPAQAGRSHERPRLGEGLGWGLPRCPLTGQQAQVEIP